MAEHREPYVGGGIDGALRSAQIDREEADTLDNAHPRYRPLLDSAERWEQQARELAGLTGDPVIARWEPPYDAGQRAAIVRDQVQLARLARTDAEAETVIAALCRAWTADHQATHEQSYSDGADGVMA